MNNLKMIHDYKDNGTYRQSFNDLAKGTFGIDFEQWYQKGCWNDSYVCYSYLDGERVVANVSINKMCFVVGGQEYRALQIGTVMTHPDYRRRGLAASLMNTVFAEYEGEFEHIFLFPDEDALDFYRRFGFESYKLYQYSAEVQSKPCPGKMRKLNTADVEDLRLIIQRAEDRGYLSKVFDVANTQHILLWYCFNILPNDVYYLEDEDVIVFYRRKGEVLHLFDVVGPNELDLTKVVERIIAEDTKKVFFYFTPDQMEWKCEFEETEELLFVKPALKGDVGEISFPMTGRA